MDLDKAIKSRRSVRKFKSKKPDWRDIVEAIDSARYAPIAGGNYTLKFILVDDPEKIQKIAGACQQDFVGQAQYLVVACSDSGRLTNSYGKNGEIYSRQQAGAAMQNFLLKIQDFGLATCWVGYFVESQIKNTLNIPKEVNIEAVFPIGFEYAKPKTRKTPTDINNILRFNDYEEKNMKQPKKLDV
jgi:nitroreductase